MAYVSVLLIHLSYQKNPMIQILLSLSSSKMILLSSMMSAALKTSSHMEQYNSTIFKVSWNSWMMYTTLKSTQILLGLKMSKRNSLLNSTRYKISLHFYFIIYFLFFLVHGYFNRSFSIKRRIHKAVYSKRRFERYLGYFLRQRFDLKVRDNFNLLVQINQRNCE